MSYPQEVKDKAIRLRKKGYSIKEVAKRLKIAQSTSSLWLREVELNENAQKRLRKRKIYGQQKARLIRKRKRLLKEKKYNNWAKKKLSNLNKSLTNLQILCSLLYWAEGSKFTDNRLEFTNSDENLIKTFLLLLRKAFDINESKLRANIHIHEYHNDDKQKRYWSKITGIPLSQFNKSWRKPNTKRRIRKDYPGCVRICYYNADVARKIKALYENIVDYL
jgi:hypothetical protein